MPTGPILGAPLALRIAPDGVKYAEMRDRADATARAGRVGEGPSATSPLLCGAMSQVEYLRNQAQKCFRLARSILDPKAVAELEKLGRELEQKAAELEQDAGHRRSPRRQDRGDAR